MLQLPFIASVISISTLFFSLSFIYKVFWLPRALIYYLKKQNIPSLARNFPLGQSLDIFFNPEINKFYKENRIALGKTYLHYIGTIPVLNTTNPEIIKQFLVTKHSLYKRSDVIKFIFCILSGEPLFILDGKEHRKMRKYFSFLYKPGQVDLMANDFGLAVSHTINYWEKNCNLEKEIEINVHKELTTIAVDCSYKHFLDCFYSNQQNNKTESKFHAAIDRAVNCLNYLIAFYLPIAQRLLYWIGLVAMSSSAKQLEKAANTAIEKYIRNHVIDQSFPDDFIGNILKNSYASVDNVEEKLTRKQIIDNLKFLFFVGQETITSCLSWTLYLLANNIEYQNKLREIIKRICEKNTKSSLLTHKQLKELPQVLWLIQESLRMFPPAIGVMRTATKTHQINNINIPEGLSVSCSIYGMHHDPSLWKDDPEIFYPERFANGTMGATNHPLAFLPFGIGRQNCIGQRYALLQIQIVVVMILQRFIIRLDEKIQVKPLLKLSLKPKDLKLKLEIIKTIDEERIQSLKTNIQSTSTTASTA